MPFVSKSGVSSQASQPDDRKTIIRLLNAARTGVDVAFRSLTLDALLVRGIAKFNQLTATTLTSKSFIDSVTGAPIGAGGVVPNGIAIVNSSQGPTAPPFDIVGASVTVNFIKGRRYKVSAQSLITSSVATDGVQLAIVEDITDVQLTNETIPAAGGASGSNRASFVTALTTSNAPHTFKLAARRNGGGTGNFTNNAAASFPTYILVEDIGSN